MRREDLADLHAFLGVLDHGSFTRAAAELGVSQSSLSHTVRRLETRLGVRLITRTTRSVAPTQAGDRLRNVLRPALDSIRAEIEALGDLRQKPAGTIRINTSEHAANTLLWPAFERLLTDYPDINMELGLDSGLTDIVAERFDAGVRLGEALAKDMIAVRIGPDLRMAVVGSPAYFAGRPVPRTPQDLASHSGVNLRFRSGDVYAWEFAKDGRELRVRVEGRLVFNNVRLAIRAVAAGFGLACVLEDHVEQQVRAGALVRVLEDWCPLFAGYHLYYPSRRQQSATFSLFIDAVRYRC